jgi:tetratricopeptide (TPR) repeat protein
MGRGSVRALALPLAFILLLGALGGAIPGLRQHVTLFWSFEGAAAALLAWWAVMFVSARRGGRTLTIEVSLRSQHYMQACAHLSILLYWGWYWREVYHSAPLILGQLVFAYAFDALLAWSRRDVYTFGFGPFPIIFSTNLFLWFKPDWFYLQFLMVGVGFTAKEMIRWTKDGRRTHIFNPSSFTLAIFSLGLLLTGSTAISWGPEIASTQARPPYIYLWIFSASLVGQFLFGVASMTWAAVATTYGFCLAYFWATGTHFFAEQPIPIAVFLGMHLLFTDPSTAPRTDLGRLIFGVMYGASVVIVAAVLTGMGLPAFYDKLLPVPVLNLTIQGIDRIVRSDALRTFDPGVFARNLRPRLRNASYMGLWAATFVAMVTITGTHTTLMRADTLMETGQVDEALSRYREFVRTDPNEAEGHSKLAVALMQKGQYDEAVAELERAVQLDPHIALMQDNLGVALLRSGRAEEAVAALQRAADLDPANVKTYNNLGVALMRTGRNAQAVAALRRAVEIEPANSEAHDNLGQALLMAGSTDESIRALQEAVRLEPGNVGTRDNLGVALMRAGRFADAVTTLQQAVAIAPQSAEAHDNLGQALLQQGKVDEAAASLRKAVELKPDYADAHFNLAQALKMAGHPREAANEVRAALRTQPDWPLALTTLAWLEATERDAPRDPEDAVRLASRAAELTRQRDPQVLEVLAAAYASAGRLDEAAQASAASKALAPARP